MSDLTTVNNTLKEQNDLLKGNRSQELENKREQDRKDAEMLKILRGLKPTVALDGKKSKDSFLTSVLKGFGLIGAGALGLAAGLTAGWLTFVTKLIGKVGKFLFKLVDMIPRPKFLDDFINAFKAEGKIGQIFMKIKNFFIGETSVFKRIGTLVDSAVDGVKSFTGGIFGKIKNFFVGETSIFKRIGKIVDTAVDAVKAFGGGIFTKIGNFFGGETSIFKRIKTAIDPVIDIVKGMGGGIFTKIGNVFQSIKNFGATLASPFKVIGDLLGMGGDAAKVADSGGGIVKTIMKFLSPMKTVFKAMAGLGRILGAPLTIIMGLLDAGFETKDAVEKSEGFFASILNGIFGAIGGFIDGAFLQVADLLKDGIAWIAGFFGFTEIEKSLDSFSFSKIFNEFLDGVYNFVNGLFNLDIAALANSLIPEGSALRRILPDSLFESSGGGALTKPTGMSIKEFESLRGNADIDQKALEMVMMSRQNEAASGTKAPVVIQQDNRQDNRQSMNQTTSLNAPASTRTNESTVRALQGI
jgi:hypothetical protein|tara:strand:+ start:1690 stop:3267 length:1578 start_codon:yes stop_codon:yes gene_type:complete